ncbi:hypothetical protein [Microtetraspora glauca]|uniref:Helix-turn-helix domain-containing protein n=1 Tax=Microtetraspora glauca TaxID=1996 RepID=A0ABV3GA33_MICGL
MSGKLVGEVVEWLRSPAADGMSLAERVVLLVVAERGNDNDRVMWRHRTDTESLFERIRSALGVTDGALGNVFGRLAKRGLEVRIPTGTDKRGRPTFANNGHSMRFRLPELPPSVTLPPVQRSIDGWAFPVDNAPPKPVENPPAEPGKVHQPMDHHDERPINEWTFKPGRSIDGWTVNPSKNNPSKSDPSTPVVPVSQPDVEERPAIHREPSAKRDQRPTYRQPPILAAVPQPGPDSPEYTAARDTLTRLPDLGAAYLAQARDALGDSTPRIQLVIHAATLARRTA